MTTPLSRRSTKLRTDASREAQAPRGKVHKSLQPRQKQPPSSQRLLVANTIVSPLNRTILITGGAGFLGSSLAERLVEHNRVILFDRAFVCGPIQYTSLLQHPNITTIRGDILDADLSRVVQDVDIIVHAAAVTDPYRVGNSGRKTLATNYMGTFRLLKALEAGRKIQRFVHFSSGEVIDVNSYRVDEACDPSTAAIAESRWSYAMSKLAGEQLVTSYFRDRHLPVTIVRPFEIFGPRRTGNHLLRRFILNALQGQPLEIRGDGSEICSLCYIEDFCSAVIKMMVRSEAVGEDFDIGNPRNTMTIRELAHRVIHLTSSTSTVTYKQSPFRESSARLPSIEKAEQLLEYEAKFDLNTGLRHTIDWHREHCDLFQPAIVASNPFPDASPSPHRRTRFRETLTRSLTGARRRVSWQIAQPKQLGEIFRAACRLRMLHN